jgi:Fic family protein
MVIQAIQVAMLDYKHRIRAECKFYSQDLIHHLFAHPYTKIEFIQNDLQVSRLTATKYLDTLAKGSFLQKHKVGRSYYYVNVALKAILENVHFAVGG